MDFIFHPAPPYNFALTAQVARFYSSLGLLGADGVWRRAVRIDGRLAVLDLTSAGTVDAPIVHAHLTAADGPIAPLSAQTHIGRIVNTGLNVAPFYQVAAADPAMQATIAGLRGLHSFQLDSLWESLAFTIIEQQIALRQAQIAERWLIATYGDAVDHPAGRFHSFPTPERLAALTEEDLRPLKITFIRINRLRAIARRIAERELDLEGLRDAPLSDAYAALCALPGVGHWTAAWALIRARGEFLEIGGADVALRAAVNRYVYGQQGRVDKAVMADYFAQFGRWAGLAQFYLLTRYALDQYA